MIIPERAIAFFLRDLRIAFSYRLKFFSQFGGIAVSTMLFYYVGELVGPGRAELLEPYGGNYFAFALIGVAFTDYLFISINSFADEVRRGQLQGTFESLLVTPLPVPVIMIYSSLYNFCFTSLRVGLYLVCGIFFFGLQLQLADPLALLIVLVLTITGFWGIGLASAAFVIVFKQGSPINWLMGPLAGLAGGVIFPISVLPWWLKWVSMLLPITHALEALRRLLLNGASLNEVGVQLLILFCFAVVLMTGGLLLFRGALKIAKKQGSLLHY